MSSKNSVVRSESRTIIFTIPTTAEAIYGTVLVCGVIAGESLYDPSPRKVLITSVAMLVIFWLTHVYANVAADAGAHRVMWQSIVEHARQESPMLLAVVVPGAALLAAAFRGVEAGTAIGIALWCCVAQLATAGALLAYRRGLSAGPIVSNGLICGASGVAVVLLKTILA